MRVFMSKKNLDNLLENEFLCYYHIDLLPIDWKKPLVIKKLAAVTSGRLNELVSNKEELKQLLLEMKNERNHYLNEKISEEVDIEWCIEDDDWLAYAMLLEEIVKGL